MIKGHSSPGITTSVSDQPIDKPESLNHNNNLNNNINTDVITEACKPAPVLHPHTNSVASQITDRILHRPKSSSGQRSTLTSSSGQRSTQTSSSGQRSALTSDSTLHSVVDGCRQIITHVIGGADHVAHADQSQRSAGSVSSSSSCTSASLTDPVDEVFCDVEPRHQDEPGSGLTGDGPVSGNEVSTTSHGQDGAPKNDPDTANHVTNDSTVSASSSSAINELENKMAELPTVQHKAPLLRNRQTKSLYGASPNCRFGPKARVMKNKSNILTIQDPAGQKLTWSTVPTSVLIIKKIHDANVIQPFIELCSWLIKEKQMFVFVEVKVLEDPHLKNNPKFELIKNHLTIFNEDHDDLTDRIDFVICLGGDGTLIYTSSLFQQSVPPVLAFHLGSLGFLTHHSFDKPPFQQQVLQVIEGNSGLTLRSRLRCVVSHSSSENLKKLNTKPYHMVLNEVVIDRGPSCYICNIDLYIENRYITSVQGDGLIICTPTGSTAYAAACGASMIHPSVPAILITPICAHSLSFRPVVVPAGVEIKVMISPNAREDAWVSFDGRNRQQISKDDVVRISTSIYPVPSICNDDQISDWFSSLSSCLHWNTRKQQSALNPSSPNKNQI